MGESLYSLAKDRETAINGGFVYDEDTGEVMWDSSNLEELGLAIADKAEACAVVLKDKRAFAQALKDERDSLDKRLRAIKAQADRLEDYITQCLEIAGTVETPRARLSIRKSQALDILDEGQVPDKYMRVKTTRVPDKIAIKAALKEGEYVPGCALVTNSNLQVR